MNGMVGTNLMILLECRLDNVLFRMGLGRTRKAVSYTHLAVYKRQHLSCSFYSGEGR